MAVNLTKNRDSLHQTWKEVVDDKNDANWAIFGYEGQTFDLKVVSKGDGGLEEMVEDLNSGKIMYAFCRVIDPKTSLPKFVLINWQGEGAPGDRKGKCANHINDISNFFTGAHVTINARTEDDVEPSIVLDKVSKSTGSVYSFKDRAGPLQDHKPVGSVYRRIIPAAEINPAERDKFWEKQETEEKRRLEEDRRKAEDAQRKLEEERHQRELLDAQRRERMIKERTSSISQIRQAENAADGIVHQTEEEKKRWQKQMEDDAEEERRRKQRSDVTRQERNEELQTLISQRTINARAIFEQNTSAGQMSSMNTKYPSRQFSKEFPKANAISNGDRGALSPGHSSSGVSPPSTGSPPSYRSPLSPDETPPSPAPASPPMSYNSSAFSDSSKNSHVVSDPANASQQYNQLKDSSVAVPEWKDAIHNQSSVPTVAESVLKETYEERDLPQGGGLDVVHGEQLSNAVEPDLATAKLVYADGFAHDIYEGQDDGQGLMARALYDYQAADETEISFNPDDVITNIDQIDEGWWQGLAPDGTYGLFPANYVELIE